MAKRNPFNYVKSSPEIIILAVMLYIRIPLYVSGRSHLLGLALLGSGPKGEEALRIDGLALTAWVNGLELLTLPAFQNESVIDIPNKKVQPPFPSRLSHSSDGGPQWLRGRSRSACRSIPRRWRPNS